MRVVRCPRCGHENRAAISVSICDRCACDISTLPDLYQQPTDRDLRLNPDEVVVQERPVAAPPEVVAPQPAPIRVPAERPRARRNPLAVIGRVLLALAAVTAGVMGGLALAIGSALQAEPHLAGSIAILAAAAAICGLVMVLIGGSPDRSTGVTVGLRAAGFLLAVMGVWAVTVISHGAIRGERPPAVSSDEPVEVITTGPMMGGPGMGMGPGTMGGAPGPGMGPMGRPGMPPEGSGATPPVGPPSGGAAKGGTRPMGER
ncbi:MAG: hypothetical protein FJX75_21255 [Armatimonadetes bacterium]|nr:hypothetical protein [Armatimonadota bacterium]